MYYFHYQKKSGEPVLKGTDWLFLHVDRFHSLGRIFLTIISSFCRELEKITVDDDDLYLPTAPNKLVRSIQVDSGIPLQSAAKVPIMITFNVADKNGDLNDLKPQACIFKVLSVAVLSLQMVIFKK